MTGNSIFLYIIIILGLLARSRVIVLAGFSLLLAKELGLSGVFEFLSNKGIEIGLIFLLMAILTPLLLLSSLEREDLQKTLFSWKSAVAIIAGLLATRFNGLGLKLLEESPEVVVGIVIGSLIGIIFFGGIPVGPLMAAGIAAILTGLIERVFRI